MDGLLGGLPDDNYQPSRIYASSLTLLYEFTSLLHSPPSRLPSRLVPSTTAIGTTPSAAAAASTATCHTTFASSSASATASVTPDVKLDPLQRFLDPLLTGNT